MSREGKDELRSGRREPGEQRAVPEKRKKGGGRKRKERKKAVKESGPPLLASSSAPKFGRARSRQPPPLPGLLAKRGGSDSLGARARPRPRAPPRLSRSGHARWAAPLRAASAAESRKRERRAPGCQ